MFLCPRIGTEKVIQSHDIVFDLKENVDWLCACTLIVTVHVTYMHYIYTASFLNLMYATLRMHSTVSCGPIFLGLGLIGLTYSCMKHSRTKIFSKSIIIKGVFIIYMRGARKTNGPVTFVLL